MSLSYYDPFFSFSDISRFFDDLFSRTDQQGWRTSEQSRVRRWTPAMDIAETDDKAILTLELPGLDKEGYSLDAQNGRLVVSGEKTIPKVIEEKGFVHCERQMGRFSRSVPLPTGIKPNEVLAKMENGLLTVTFPPKRSQEQQAHTRKITIV